MPEHTRIRIILAFAAIYLIWGATYLAIRIGLETLPPFMMAGSRFLVGGLLVYALMRLGGAKKPERSTWYPAGIIGLLLPAGGTGLVCWAELTVPSGLTALLIALAPMWIVLADWLGPSGKRPGLVVVLGLVLGFVSVAFLINPTDIGGPAEIDRFGAFLIVAATIFWATGSIYSRHAHQPPSKMLATGMQMIIGGAFLLILSMVTGEYEGFDLSAVSMRSWLAVAFQVSFGSLAFAAYIWLLGVTTPARVATYAYVNPVIALALGSIVAGEALSQRTLGCAAVVVVAVVIIITAKGRSRVRDERV